ncbi:MAG: ferredoxin [Candidatus Njordarchaeota archaeon]
MAKVKIDPDKCIACGVCMSLCPDVFVAGDDGKSQLAEQFRKDSPHEGEIPEDLLECAQNAAGSCPNQAITIE